MSFYLCDTNVWLALSIPSHLHHGAAQRWLNGIHEVASVLFCRATQQSFLRLVSTAALVAPYGLRAMSNDDAWSAFENLISDDRLVLQVQEPTGIERVWKQYTARSTPSPKLWMDAYLAAFARAGGYTLVTTDAAMRQFSGLDLLLLSDSLAT